MEAERRSTMSSLKGQLSNVEGSVKSMKAAVVVGSVLTVACLAAVFGVTVLANEVSKEVKVSNGVLATKSGKTVLTTSLSLTSTADKMADSVIVDIQGQKMISKVNSIVEDSDATYMLAANGITVVDAKNGQTATILSGDSILYNYVDNVEKRQINPLPFLAAAAAKVGAACVANPVACAAVGSAAFVAVKGFVEGVVEGVADTVE